MSPPLPNLILCSITGVVVRFWLAIMFGGWPFNVVLKNQVISGVLMWIAAYAVNYALYRVLFNFAFLKGAPVYVEALDPGGLYKRHERDGLLYHGNRDSISATAFRPVATDLSAIADEAAGTRDCVDSAGSCARRCGLLHRCDLDGHGSDDVPDSSSDPIYLWNHSCLEHAAQLDIRELKTGLLKALRTLPPR